VYSQADEEGEKDEDDDSGTQALPSMAQGDAVTCTDATRKDAKTKPPARFTEGTLIRAMENIHKFVSDAEHKKMLREGDGIGTSATRASIISELKRREFLAVKGKQIISTTLGRSVIDALPEVVKSPVLTARLRADAERRRAGLRPPSDAFITKQETFIRDQVAKANSGAVTIAGGKEAAPGVIPSQVHGLRQRLVDAGRARRRGNSGGVAATSPHASRPTPTSRVGPTTARAATARHPNDHSEGDRP